MNDVFKSLETDLGRIAEVFCCVPGQIGLLAFINDRPVGFDLVSLRSAYAILHPKLVRSYAIEGLLDSSQMNAPGPDLTSAAKEFIGRVFNAGERSFPSVGCGSDCRYRGEALAGAALVHADEVIHAAFFQIEGQGRTDTERMAS